MPERAFTGLAELLTKSLISGDFDLYLSILTLPMKFTPRDGASYVLADEAALREDFDLYVAIIRLHGVTDIYRQVLGFDQIDDAHVVARVMVHILARANLLASPFESRITMKRAGDGWRIAEIESSEGHLNWTLGRAVLTPEGQFQEKQVED